MAILIHMLRMKWIGKEMEGRGNRLIWWTLPVFPSRGRGIPRTPSIWIVRLWAKIRSRDLPISDGRATHWAVHIRCRDASGRICIKAQAIRGHAVAQLVEALCYYALPPGRFLVLISVRPQGHSAAGRIRSTEKESNDLIGNQTRDLPACSIVPRPTTLPRAPE
jgi:hypothetical protein